MEWNKLDQTEQLEQILSNDALGLIFKHSTRCHISSMALSSFKKEWDIPAEQCKLFLLDLLAYRSLSDEIAHQTGVVHQSPQVILIKGGKVVHTSSHHNIDAKEISSKCI
jgi:bacillithiol system protein YtxJ